MKRRRVIWASAILLMLIGGLSLMAVNRGAQGRAAGEQSGDSLPGDLSSFRQSPEEW